MKPKKTFDNVDNLLACRTMDTTTIFKAKPKYSFPEKLTPEYIKMKTTAKGIRSIIGNRVREARLKKNISQMSLGFLLGVDQQYISKVESGKINISLESLFKICYYLELFISIEEKPVSNYKAPRGRAKTEP